MNITSDEISGMVGGNTQDFRDLMRGSACSNFETITDSEDMGSIIQSSRTNFDYVSNLQAHFETQSHPRNPCEGLTNGFATSDTNSLKPKKSLKPRNRASLTPVRRA